MDTEKVKEIERKLIEYKNYFNKSFDSLNKQLLSLRLDVLNENEE